MFPEYREIALIYYAGLLLRRPVVAVLPGIMRNQEHPGIPGVLR
jgi:hypothetical protein